MIQYSAEKFRDAVVKAECRAAEVTKSVLKILEARDRLSRWLRRAVLASSAGEVTSEP
jgi:hypothetical protein